MHSCKGKVVNPIGLAIILAKEHANLPRYMMKRKKGT